MSRTIGLGLLLSFFAGCGPDTEAIERTASKAFEEIVKPVVTKGIEELEARTAQIQGQLSGINPGYVVEGYGIFGTGIVYKVIIRLDGVSANLGGSSQADQGEGDGIGNRSDQ